MLLVRVITEFVRVCTFTCRSITGFFRKQSSVLTWQSDDHHCGIDSGCNDSYPISSILVCPAISEAPTTAPILSATAGFPIGSHLGEGFFPVPVKSAQKFSV